MPAGKHGKVRGVGGGSRRKRVARKVLGAAGKAGRAGKAVKRRAMKKKAGY